jgi:hypothetical protein
VQAWRERQKSPQLSDYDCSLIKSFEGYGKKGKKRAAKEVPQLGMQPKRSISPLVIHNDQPPPQGGSLNIDELSATYGQTINIEQFLADAEITDGQFHENEPMQEREHNIFQTYKWAGV